MKRRGYDGSLGRFLSPDSIVPTSTQGTQAWDRYAFVNNNPIRYNNPTGHMIDDGCDNGCGDPDTAWFINLSNKTNNGKMRDRYRQKAIIQALKEYNIRTKRFFNGVPTYNPNLDVEGNTAPDGTVQIGADAYRSAGWLAKTLAHEGIHSMQAAQGRYYDLTDREGSGLNETEAHDFVIATADEYGLTDSDLKEIMERRDMEYNTKLYGTEAGYDYQVDHGYYTKTGSTIVDWWYWLANPGEWQI